MEGNKMVITVIKTCSKTQVNISIALCWQIFSSCGGSSDTGFLSLRLQTILKQTAHHSE